MSYLARTGVLAREPDPTRIRACWYELIGSLTRYVALLNDRLCTEQELRHHKRPGGIVPKSKFMSFWTISISTNQ
jgi:hypothetical protein